MRAPLTAALLITFALASTAAAQALDPQFVYGRDYTFERMEATRIVHDAEDDGPIRLVSYVYRPLRNDRHEVILFSHGSTGGIIRSPKEQGDAPPPAVMHYFVGRGYTVVAPMRRGRGESSGTYVEECAFYLGKCTLAQQTALTERSLHEAMLDTNAVIDQVILGRLVPRDAKILLGGISRGGFLSLFMAGERPSLVKGVVNFAGGWLSVNDKYSVADYKSRLDAQTSRLSKAAKQTAAPTIWIYADRDPFYNEAGRQALLRSWREGGGQADYTFVARHSLSPNGHAVATNAALWKNALDAFMARVEAPKQ